MSGYAGARLRRSADNTPYTDRSPSLARFYSGSMKMICCDQVRKSVIRRHYDVSTPFYRLLWGPHIHHGLWDADETVAAAQLHLTETLARLAKVESGQRVLDVGCGMGGSSIHLAKHYACHVTGLTLSPVQRHWATWSSRCQRASRRTEFLCADADRFEAEASSFDRVWSIECTEHLFDKPAFFQRAARWLRSGGRIAICAWLAGDTAGNADRRRQVHDVCEGFFCPSLGTTEDYQGWMEAAGLSPIVTYDWTDRVQRTWEICLERVARSRVRYLAHLIDDDAVLFLDRFATLLRAYQSGAMRYGCFIANKPSGCVT